MSYELRVTSYGLMALPLMLRQRDGFRLRRAVVKPGRIQYTVRKVDNRWRGRFRAGGRG
jgi:hypothetical protein